MFVTGLVLAAGHSRRLGSPKQLLPYRGGTLLGATVDAARRCGFDELLVTLGHAADEVLTGVDLRGARAVVVTDHAEGCGGSLRQAVPEVSREADGLVLLLGDQPGIRPDAVRELLRGAEDAPVAVCRYRDGVGHPFWFRADRFDELAELHGDKAVRELLHQESSRVTEVPVPGTVPIDVDTWQDYRRLTGSTSVEGVCR